MNEGKFYFIDTISKGCGKNKNELEKELSKSEIFFRFEEQEMNENPLKQLYQIIKNLKEEANKKGKGISIFIDHLEPLFFILDKPFYTIEFLNYLRSMITQTTPS